MSYPGVSAEAEAAIRADERKKIADWVEGRYSVSHLPFLEQLTASFFRTGQQERAVCRSLADQIRDGAADRVKTDISN